MNGASNITMTGNEISGNNTDDWERRQPGCGCSGGGKFWEVKGATVTDNYVHDNHGVGLWADTNNSGFLFKGNYIADNDGEGLMYEASYNAAPRRQHVRPQRRQERSHERRLRQSGRLHLRVGQ